MSEQPFSQFNFPRPVRTDYRRFSLYGVDGGGIAVMCRNCHDTNAPEPDDLADYVAWADGHRCEVKG